MARPASRPAPSVVASSDGRDLDRASDGVGQRLDEDVVVGHAAVDAQRRRSDTRCRPPTPRPGPRLDGPPPRARPGRSRDGPSPGSARPACRGRRSPTPVCRGPSSAGTNQTSPVLSHCAATASDSSDDARSPRSSRSHSTQVPAESMTASVPQVALPPTRKATMGKVPPVLRCALPGPAPWPVHWSSMPPVPKVALARPGQRAALADERGLLVAGDAADRRGARAARTPRRRRRRSRRCAGSMAAGIRSCFEQRRGPTRWSRRRPAR